MWQFRAAKNKANSKPIIGKGKSKKAKGKNGEYIRSFSEININGYKRAGGCRGNAIISLNFGCKNV